MVHVLVRKEESRDFPLQLVNCVQLETPEDDHFKYQTCSVSQF
jgi:hypothetical protein